MFVQHGLLSLPTHHLNITALHSSECFSVLYSPGSTLHMSVCLLFLTYEVRDLAASFELLPLFSWQTEVERRGRLQRMMTIKFTTTQNSAAHTELAKVMGMECSRSQVRRVTMSCSMAFIWKWVPRMPHTWKSWWLWPAEGAVESWLSLRSLASQWQDKEEIHNWANESHCQLNYTEWKTLEVVTH